VGTAHPKLVVTVSSGGKGCAALALSHLLTDVFRPGVAPRGIGERFFR
jgi:hypothetical protein